MFGGSIMNKKVVICVLSVILIFFLWLNIAQYTQLNNMVNRNNNFFHICVKRLAYDLEQLTIKDSIRPDNMEKWYTTTKDKNSKIIISIEEINTLSFDIGEVVSSYLTSSFSDKNTQLLLSFSAIRDIIDTNKNNQVITKKDLMDIVSILKIIEKDSLNLKATEELNEILNKINFENIK